VGEDVCRHLHAVAGDPLDAETAAVDARANALDHDATAAVGVGKHAALGLTDRPRHGVTDARRSAPPHASGETTARADGASREAMGRRHGATPGAPPRGAPGCSPSG